MATEDQVRADIELVDWEPMWTHFAYDRVRVVNGTRSLLEVAVAVANDDAAMVKQLLDSSEFGTPTDEQVRGWVASNQLFEMVVIQPFVIIRPKA
jgi:hypothetical protein